RPVEMPPCPELEVDKDRQRQENNRERRVFFLGHVVQTEARRSPGEQAPGMKVNESRGTVNARRQGVNARLRWRRLWLRVSEQGSHCSRLCSELCSELFLALYSELWPTPLFVSLPFPRRSSW